MSAGPLPKHVVGIRHFVERRKIRPATVSEMLINLPNRLFHSGEGSGIVKK